MKRLLPALLALFMLLAACGPAARSLEDSGSDTDASETAAPGPVMPDTPESGLFGIPFALPASGVFNPVTDQSDLNAAFIPLVYDSLFKRDGQFRPTPMLCRAYAFSEGALTLTLKEGVYFHDGAELTAADAAYSLNLAKTGNPLYAVRLSPFSDIRATGRYTLSLAVSEQNVRLLALLDVPVIKINSGVTFNAVGSGRYLMQKSDELSFLSPFSAWHGTDGEEPAVPHLLLVEVGDMDALIYNLSAGNLDGLLADPLNGQDIAFHADADRYYIETPSLFYLAYNLARPVFQNVDVRVGLARLIDRAALAADAFSGALSPVTGLFPYSSALDDEEMLSAQAGFDRAAGLALLEKAGFRPHFSGTLRNAAGQGLSVSILVNGDNAGKTAAAKQIAGMLTNAGVSAAVNAPSFGEYKKAAENGEFDLLLAETALAPDFDFSFLLAENGALNLGKYAGAGVSALLEGFAQTVFTEAEYAGAALAGHVASFAPIVPLGYKKTVLLIRKANKLSNIKPTASDPFDNILNWAKP